MEQNRDNWKSITYLLGAVMGLFVGVMAAHLYARAAEEHTAGAPPRIQTGDALRIGLATLTLIRQISALGAKEIEERR